MLRVERHPREQHDVRDRGRHGGADHAPARDEPEVQTHVDRGADAGDDPVQLGLAGAAAADREHDVARVHRAGEREQRDAFLRALVAWVGQEANPPRRERAQRQRGPRGEGEQIRQHERVRPLRLGVVLDRIRERGPGSPERDHHERDQARDLHRGRIHTHLGVALVPADELAVDEVDRPQRECRRNERHPEVLHLPQELRVELRSELLVPVPEQHRVDDERTREVADDEADGAPVEVGDEEHHRGDRDEHVRDARDRVLRRALLDAEERRQLLVVRLRPQSDGARAHERRVVSQPEPMADRGGEDDAEHEPERRHRHGEPEGRPDHDETLRVLLGVEVEAEEGARDPELEHDRKHRSRSGDDLDAAIRSGGQVVRVEGEEQRREDSRHEAAEAVDRGVAAQALELLPEPHQSPLIEVQRRARAGGRRRDRRRAPVRRTPDSPRRLAYVPPATRPVGAGPPQASASSH